MYWGDRENIFDALVGFTMGYGIGSSMAEHLAGREPSGRHLVPPDFDFHEFVWARVGKGSMGGHGWTSAIPLATSTDREAFDLFFELLEDYEKERLAPPGVDAQVRSMSAATESGMRGGAVKQRREPRVGVGCVVIREGRVLLVRRHAVHGDGTWSTPGGHLDFGESPEECAARETLEETGVRVQDVEFLAVTNDLFPSHDKHYVTLWMRAEHLEGNAFVAAPDELAEVGWFPVTELPSPLFSAFENLLARRCHPPEPPRLPLHVRAEP